MCDQTKKHFSLNQTFRTFWMVFSLQKYFRQSVTSAHILKVQFETNAILRQSSSYIHSSRSLLLHGSSDPHFHPVLQSIRYKGYFHSCLCWHYLKNDQNTAQNTRNNDAVQTMNVQIIGDTSLAVTGNYNIVFFSKHHAAERWDLEFGLNTTEEFEITKFH